MSSDEREYEEMVNEYRLVGGYRIHLLIFLRNNFLRVIDKSDKLFPKIFIAETDC